MPTAPVAGTKQFQLIGVSVFDLPSYKDQTVVLECARLIADDAAQHDVEDVDYDALRRLVHVSLTFTSTPWPDVVQTELLAVFNR